MAHPIRLYAAHLRASGASDGTIRIRTDHAASIADLGPLDELDVHRLEQWVQPRGRRYAAETLKSRQASARRFIDWLEDNGAIDGNPARRLRSVHVPTQPPRVIPDDEMQRRLGQITSRRDRAAVLLGRYGCLRLAEIARARTTDRHGDQLRIRGKGGKQRIIYMHPDLAHALDELEREQGAGYYFPGRTGPHLHPQSLHKIIKRVTGWNPHALRHAGATAAYRATKDLRAVQLMLGHSSLKTTQRYLSLDEDALRAVGAAVALPEPERRPSPVRSIGMSSPGFEVVEWEVRGPLDGLPLAIVRLLHLGPHREPYWRAVTAESDPQRRELIGYYGSADDAHDAAIYHAEQRAQRSVFGGNRVPSARYVPQKPPPATASDAAA